MANATTVLGYTNRNNQRNCGCTGQPGNDHNQMTYRMQCLNLACGHTYGANGSDIWQRRCPKCQGGRPGLDI